MKGPFRLKAHEVDACEAVIRRHSRSFHTASRLLPTPVRHASWALYAFCRGADDAIDEAPDARSGAAQLAHQRARLAALYAGEAPLGPLEAAFAHFVDHAELPRALPEALLDGVGSDLQPVRMATWDELTAYSFRVASTVGLMMTRAMGVDDGEAHLRAADLGVAMQLTNIARDVGADARLGRLYLPQELLSSWGVDGDAFLAEPTMSPALASALAELLTRAEAHYASGLAGVPLLPWACRPAIASARTVYGAIGGVLAAKGHDSVAQRVRTSAPRKLAEIAKALVWVVAHPQALSQAPYGPAEAQLRHLIRKVGLQVDGPTGGPCQPENHAASSTLWAHGPGAVALRPEG